VRSYLDRAGFTIEPRFEIDNYAMAMSLAEAERGVAILPASVESYLPASLVMRLAVDLRAICDPDLTPGLPPYMAAATRMDARSHCIETFCSPA
jgi:DNA-binding transcriptional LysR family regulator